MSQTIIRVIVTGRVQGVAFRDFVQRRACERNVAGWVRNRRDGSVEAVFAGHPESVAEMVAACRQGPPAARVMGVETAPGTTELLKLGLEAGFSVLPTA